MDATSDKLAMFVNLQQNCQFCVFQLSQNFLPVRYIVDILKCKRPVCNNALPFLGGNYLRSSFRVLVTYEWGSSSLYTSSANSKDNHREPQSHHLSDLGVAKGWERRNKDDQTSTKVQAAVASQY